MVASAVPNSCFAIFTLSMSKTIYKGSELLNTMKK